MKSNLPSTFTRPLLWLHKPAEEKYMVLGGQHTTKALLLLRDEYTREKVPIPAWCRKVNARVLRPSMDLDTRERLAGDHQCE